MSEINLDNLVEHGLTFDAAEAIRNIEVDGRRPFDEIIPKSYIQFRDLCWLCVTLSVMPDRASTFPHGKWATIQRLQGKRDAEAGRIGKEVS